MSVTRRDPIFRILAGLLASCLVVAVGDRQDLRARWRIEIGEGRQETRVGEMNVDPTDSSVSGSGQLEKKREGLLR